MALNFEQDADGNVLIDDDKFFIRDNSDRTKKLQFQLSGLTTATTRTLTAPDASGQIDSSVGGVTLNIGAVNGATVSAVEKGNGVIHQTVLTFTATPLTLADATVGAGVKVYDFPAGRINILGAVGSIALTTTSALASTLNASVTYNWGIGTTTQASGTLATTEQNILTTANGTASATVNVAGAAAVGGVAASAGNLDGTSTAIDAYLNIGIATATDIDGDATVTLTGTATITWIYEGDQ